MKFAYALFVIFYSLTTVTSEPPALEEPARSPQSLSPESEKAHTPILAERETSQRPSLEEQVRTMHTALTRKSNSLSAGKNHNALVLLVEQGNGLTAGRYAHEEDGQAYLNEARALLSLIAADSTKEQKNNRTVNSKGAKQVAKHSC